MSKIIIEATTSYLAEDSVKALLKGGFVAKSARISYNINRGLPHPEDINLYPLVLEGLLNRSPVKVYVFSVTAGYGGTGPHAMVDILKAAGFQFNSDDILTDRSADSNRQINLKYTRL